MLVDRSRFLKLAVALAATTSVATAACSATPEEADAEEGAGAISAGGACSASSIKKPGEGSMSGFFAYQEGFCFDLATHVTTPDAEGITVRWFDFIYDQCRAYSAQLQPKVAEKVYSCLKQENDRRPREARTSEDPTMATTEFDVGKMYECGKEALWSICDEGIDGRVRARAERIASMLKANGDSRSLATITKEAGAVLSGIKSAGRAEIESCVEKQKYDLYTCVEGMTVGYYTESPEPGPSAAQNCIAAGEGTAPPANACDAVMTKIAGEEDTAAFTDFARAQCNMYLEKFQPGAAAEAIACLTKPNSPAYQNIYTCGATGLKKTCKDPGLDTACKEIVDSITAVDRNANKGGRITRQCRTMFPGLKLAARNEVKSCVPALARSFGQGSAQYAFYSCVEGLQ